MVEAVCGYDRGVEEDPGTLRRDGPGDPRCHPIEHLEGHLVAHAPVLGQEVSPGQVKEVVPGDPDPQRASVTWIENGVDERFVTGVGLGLGAVSGERPVVQGRIDTLHSQVGSLYDSDLHRRPASVHPSPSPPSQKFQRLVTIGQVGL